MLNAVERKAWGVLVLRGVDCVWLQLLVASQAFAVNQGRCCGLREGGDCGERFRYDLETELTELAGGLDVGSKGKTGVEEER